MKKLRKFIRGLARIGAPFLRNEPFWKQAMLGGAIVGVVAALGLWWLL